MPIEEVATLRSHLDQCCVMINSLRNGIVLWELQEQKCQQHVCQHSDVVQTGQAGWMVLILQWKMVKYPGRSALVIVVDIFYDRHFTAKPRRPVSGPLLNNLSRTLELKPLER